MILSSKMHAQNNFVFGIQNYQAVYKKQTKFGQMDYQLTLNRVIKLRNQLLTLKHKINQRSRTQDLNYV